MSDATKSITPDEDGALARRIAARRSTTEAPPAETKPSGLDMTFTAEMKDSIVQKPASSEDGLHDRIADRRAKRQGDADNGSAGSGEGLGFAEGFRGDVLVWLQVDGDRVSRCHLRDPSWFQWPLLESAIEGNIVADFPLCNKSFNCSYSGHDL